VAAWRVVIPVKTGTDPANSSPLEFKTPNAGSAYLPFSGVLDFKQCLAARSVRDRAGWSVGERAGWSPSDP